MESNDHIRVAIVTDTHIGYAERNAKLASESYDVFDEVLENAELHDADIIIHAGDLFDDINPSRYTVIKTMQIVQKHIIGTGSTSQEKEPPLVKYADGLTLDPNWLDQNIKIKITFLFIHGNHDQPSGFNMSSADELLSVPRLINFFKPVEKTDVVTLKPVVLERGSVRLVIYGFGYTVDVDFQRLLSEKKLKLEPYVDEQAKRTFNILMVHQNRTSYGGMKQNIPELLVSTLPAEGEPNHIDLIVWGHEHENKVEREKIGSSTTFITQPGSTICTQNKKANACDRVMAILDIYNDRDEFEPITLSRARKFIYHTGDLNEIIQGCKTNESKIKKVKEYIDDILSEFIDGGAELEDSKKPLVKIVLSYRNIDVNPLKLGQISYDYDKWVINSSDMIKMQDISKKSKETKDSSDKPIIVADEDRVEVEDVLKEKTSNDQFDFIDLDSMNDSLKSFVRNNENNAFENIVDDCFNQRLDFIRSKVKEQEITEAFTYDDARDFILKHRKELPKQVRERTGQTDTPKKTSALVSPQKMPTPEMDLHPAAENESDETRILKSLSKVRPKRRVSKK